MKLAESGCRMIGRALLRTRPQGCHGPVVLAFCVTLAQPLQAQDLTDLPFSTDARDIPGFNLNGAPGLIEMPRAAMAPDATLSGSLSRIGGITRGTITFQITPRLSGSFRYAALDGLTRLGGQPLPGLDGQTY